MAAKKQSVPAIVYQIKVTLKYSKPPIWRRIEVLGDITLAKLHRILQAVMDWGGYHLHQFIVGQRGQWNVVYYYGVPCPDYMDLEVRDEKRVKLNQIAPLEKFKFIYEYDFGDSWEHELLVEKIFPPEPGVFYPRCIKGKRARPPEDVGGVWGYDSFLEAIQDPHHSEHDDLLEWVGGEFDPEAFNLDEINQALKGFK
jgi:hypothetical protein